MLKLKVIGKLLIYIKSLSCEQTKKSWNKKGLSYVI